MSIGQLPNYRGVPELGGAFGPQVLSKGRGHGVGGRIAVLAIAQTDWSHHHKPFF